MRDSYPHLTIHVGAYVQENLLVKLGERLGSAARLQPASNLAFDNTDAEHLRSLGQRVARYAPQYWFSRGFALFDISSFSTTDLDRQVSWRLMLDAGLTAARTAIRKAMPPEEIVRFHRISTGDGYYIGHTLPGPFYDAVTFVLAVLAAAYLRGRERRGEGLHVRAAFTVGEAYTLPYFGTWGREGPLATVQDAIGPPLNELARLVQSANPDQILVGDFEIAGDTAKGEFVDAPSLLGFVSEILGPGDHSLDLTLAPKHRVHVEDRHGSVFHCFNVQGEAFFYRGPTCTRQRIGLRPADSVKVEDLRFMR
ncbi:hypothetical protein ACGF5M_00950 [Gemmatimonadota bacterium]